MKGAIKLAKKLLKVEEVCELLSISRTTLYRLKKEGLPYIKINDGVIRFEEDRVLEWIRQFETSDKK